MGDIPCKAVFKQWVVDFQETNNNLQNVTGPNNSPASYLDSKDTNENIRKVLVDQVSSDWMRFAHIICLNGLYNIVEEIQNENNNNQLKLEIFLQKINKINELNSEEVIANCLCTLKRFDILLCVALDEKFPKVKRFLIENLSTEWKRFAHETHLNNIGSIVEHIEQDNKDDESKMVSFLEKLIEIEPVQYKDKIGDALSRLGRFDILFGVALDENDETAQRIYESVSADWKRLALYTGLLDIDSVIEQIDCGNNNDQLKMVAFLNKLYEHDPLNYKKLIVKSLNVANRFDVLFRLALVESSENLTKLLLERASSDWKRFAAYACLYQVNCIIESIDQKNDSDQMKMLALLEKLFDIDPLHFKELIKSTLITMKRFNVLSAFEKDGCHVKEKAENKNVKEINEETVFLNGSIGNTPFKTIDEQNINTKESNKALHNVTNPNILSASSLNHEVELLKAQTLSADSDEEKVIVLQDQAKMDDILDKSELFLQLEMKLGKDWQKLGRFLSVSDHDLDAIDADYNDMEEKAHRMFCEWKNQQKCPTLDFLVDAIHKIKRSDLISVLEQFSKNPLKSSIEKMSKKLKEKYLKTSEKADNIVHLVKTPAKVELLNKFIELTVVDADEVEKDAVSIAERELFLQRQMAYKPIEFNEVFSKERPLLLISGIAGIGKTWLLKRCLLGWARGTLWETVDFVLHLECRKLNQFQNIGNINELLNAFYKDIFQEIDICNHSSILFVIDGLDEFTYLDELINYNTLNPSKQPIVNALADVLNIEKHKCVVAGRVGAISQYKDVVTECTDKLNIQIMGFSDKGIDEYIEKIGNKKENIKSVLKESSNAKAMASVPFYLSAMCAIIAESDFYSFNTMTELYCCIFLYFFQKHICKTNETVHRMMQKESNKQHVLRVCKVAWELFNQGKILFSQNEIKSIVIEFDEVENELSGFIERVESQLGYQYQFAHLTLMEFCASVHAHIYLSPEDIIRNKKLRSCLPMICGLANKNERCFVKFLSNLKNSNEERNSLLNAVLTLVPKEFIPWFNDLKMFVECFFEAQALITEDLKRSFDKRDWKIKLYDGKTAHEVSHEKYFTEKFTNAGFKLNELTVRKNILSEEEKKLLILCSNNVRCIYLYHPVRIDDWIPKGKIELLWINIKYTYVSKNEFEGFLPWIRLAEELSLELHKDTDFFDYFCKWLRNSNFKSLKITYRGKDFHNIGELKKIKCPMRTPLVI